MALSTGCSFAKGFVEREKSDRAAHSAKVEREREAVKSMELVESAKVGDRKYRLIGFATSSKPNPQEALAEMKLQAVRQGGSALMDVEDSKGQVATQSASGWSWTGKTTTTEATMGWKAKIIAWETAPSATGTAAQ